MAIGQEEVLAHDNGQPASSGVVGFGKKAWRKVIGYNDCEANRLGVPYVSSKDWLADIFSEPKSKVSGHTPRGSDHSLVATVY